MTIQEGAPSEGKGGLPGLRKGRPWAKGSCSLFLAAND